MHARGSGGGMETALPSAAPQGRASRRRTLVVIAALVTVFLCCCSCGTAWLTLLTSGGFIPSKMWAGDGRYLVFCYIEDPGFPWRYFRPSPSTVYAYDVDSGTLGTLPGYTLSAAELRAPQAWVVPQSQNGEIYSDRDSPVDPVMVWRLDGKTPPQRASVWMPWPGANGASAILGVDPAEGAWPSRLRFETATGTVEARLPSEMRTFSPLGWSRSGRYFAVKSQSYAGSSDRGVLLEELPPESDRIVVFDATSATPVTTYVSPEDVYTFSPSWLAEKDAILLFMCEVVDLDGPPYYATAFSLLRLSPGGTEPAVLAWYSRYASEPPEETPGFQITDDQLAGAVFVGSDRTGPIVTTSHEATSTAGADEDAVLPTDFSYVETSGLRPIDTVIDASEVIVSPRGLVAYERGPSPTSLVVSDLDGRNRRVVWSDGEE